MDIQASQPLNRAQVSPAFQAPQVEGRFEIEEAPEQLSLPHDTQSAVLLLQGRSQTQVGLIEQPTQVVDQNLDPQEKALFEQLNRLFPKEQNLLQTLLTHGILKQTGHDGRSILSYLSDLATKPCHKDVSGPKLTQELLRLLQPEDLKTAMAQADQMPMKEVDGKIKQAGIPLAGGLGEITQCPVHYTCGAASIQMLLRLQEPAEVVRLVHDLARHGEAKMRHDSLKPAPGSLDFHAGDTIYKGALKFKAAGKEDRSDLDIILQSALMEKTALGNLSSYDVDTDSGGLHNVVAGNSGSHPLYMKRTLENLTDQSYAYSHTLNLYNSGAFGRFWGNLKDPTDQTGLVNQLKQALTTGKTAIIAYQTNPKDQTALHYVTVTGYNPATDRFYYLDTAEPKAERCKMYTKTSAEMLDALRCVIYSPE